jgi:hypothetical protein
VVVKQLFNPPDRCRDALSFSTTKGGFDAHTQAH